MVSLEVINPKITSTGYDTPSLSGVTHAIISSQERDLIMLQRIARFLGGDPQGRMLKRYMEIVAQINDLEEQFEQYEDDQLAEQTPAFRQRLAEGETLSDIMPEAFAVVREVSKRMIGQRPYDVQLIGAMTLHEGKIAEMRTGEGKTLMATLPVYLNALTGRGVHVVTVNDFLARFHARWMAQIYNALGLSVGVLQMASRTENGLKAFVVDLEKRSPFDDQDQIRMVDRREAYAADITYGTNSEFGFDYLRDNLTYRLSDRVQRGHYYAIIDEVDNILIDEARTPLIISGPASDDTVWYERMTQVVRQLKPDEVEVNEKDRTVTLTELGEARVEEILQMPLRDPDRPDDINPEQARIWGYLEQSLRAQYLFRRNKDYIVQAGRVVIVDEFTGRMMPGRRWSEGLHQSVEAKEGVRIEPENVTYATITIQNYFRMYEKLAGMTGTAMTEQEEFQKIYKLEVLPIPTNLEYNTKTEDSPFIEMHGKDEDGYKTIFYSRRDDSDQTPLFWQRKDYPDVVYRTEEAKLRAITLEILRFHVFGRPQLVGTTSVEHSERLSSRLQSEMIRRLLQTLLVRDAWLEAHNKEDVQTIIPELKFMNRPIPEINTSEMRSVGRSVGLNNINPEDPGNLENIVRLVGINPDDQPRLVKVLQGGIPHQVLNARKHDEEAQIIARAGAFGMVTIATNMAGRGVDIKLGGALPEDIRMDVTRVLRRCGYEPYGMTDSQLYVAVQETSPDQYGIYGESIQAFVQHMEEMDRVRMLGGLHVIGSERHEARRIEKQLRGRAARQGDPGSSRFYLSLEDDLMRLFGGGQVENLMARLRLDDNIPIESNLLGRAVEQSQQRVEGNNFDIRKHLLEYDDVLNTQRKRIFAQRDLVFEKADLSEDVEDMLKIEVERRVREALHDEEGPWKLLAYLDDVQPMIDFENVIFPSYSLRLLSEEFIRRLQETEPKPENAMEILLDMASQALEEEQDHLAHTVRMLLEKMEENLERQRSERDEMIDMFLDGLKIQDETQPPRRPQEIVNELSDILRMPLKLSSDQMRGVAEGSQSDMEVVRSQVDGILLGLTLARLVGTLERRVEDLDLKAGQLLDLTWEEISEVILGEIEKAYQLRQDRLLGEDGQIARDLEPVFEKLGPAVFNPRNFPAFFILMSQGRQMVFDRRTHRQSYRRIIRVNYVFYAATLIINRDEEDLLEEVLDHLKKAEQAIQMVRGRVEFDRLHQNQATLSRLDLNLQELLAGEFGSDRFQSMMELPLVELEPEERDQVVTILGQRQQNEAYRELLLRMISQYWVEYLTRIEALRVSITMESYAQKDPLVQYKTRASELFQELLVDIRSGVATAMFTYRPTRSVEETVGQSAGEVVTAVEVESPQSAPGRKKKRRRH